MEISGKIVDVVHKRIFKGTIIIEEGKIKEIVEKREAVEEQYILPGWVDAHVHVESSMLTPKSFAGMALRHGTLAAVADPHEIANVLGVSGIEFMVKETEKTPMKIKFGIPSCVPATPYETSGAIIDAVQIEELFRKNRGFHLAEMMNFPGVIHGDKGVWEKIKIARKYDRIIDGHAPGVRGKELEKYIRAGIQTDHECTTLEEAVEKIEKGMKILIREGSAAKDFDALSPLIDMYPDKVMLCTDDIHPDDLAEGHINRIVERALQKGHDFWNVMRAATLNPVKFYGLEMGLLQKGDPADMIIAKNLQKLVPEKVIVNGVVLEKERAIGGNQEQETPNVFLADPVSVEDIKIKAEGNRIRVIVASEGSLATEETITKPRIHKGFVVQDTERDILKIVVYNRYEKGKAPAKGFIRGFGMQHGAIASSIAHDSHNVIAVGAGDEEIVRAVNRVVEMKGGIVAVDGDKMIDLPLPVAGLMTQEEGRSVAEQYKRINEFTKKKGTTFRAPFMTLSFMALLVIPKLKIGDRGLFNIQKMAFQKLFV